MRPQSTWTLVIGLALAAIGCAGPSASLPSQSLYIRNFQSVSSGIYRGAQPDERGMQALKDLGVKTIVSFRVPERVVEWEAAASDRYGIEFVALPLSNYDAPAEDDVRRFLALITDPARQPVYVHCRQGQLRTGAMFASYRVRREGWTVARAYAEAKRFGFDDHYPWYRPLKRFILSLNHRTDQQSS